MWMRFATGSRRPGPRAARGGAGRGPSDRDDDVRTGNRAGRDGGRVRLRRSTRSVTVGGRRRAGGQGTEGRPMEAEVLERINRGIILRTGGDPANDHSVISSGRHAREYVEKRLGATETALTEGPGGIIATTYAAPP